MVESFSRFPENEILHGDCIELMAALPAASVDMVFADPPYNLQLSQELLRPNHSRVDGVEESWDKFQSFTEYDQFTRAWLGAVRRLLKPNGTLWVIGSYHNIFRVGTALQDLGYWILNDVIWRKTNPMPNFRGRRFTNAHETMIWCAREQGARHRFNHQAMRNLNEDLQMRSDWFLPICNGRERLKLNGRKVHSTQKPEALLHRVILAATDVGDLILDPFFGSGTTGAAAKRLGRRYAGIERDEAYVRVAEERLRAISECGDAELLATPNRRDAPRIPFGRLVEEGLVAPGEILTDFSRRFAARVAADGTLATDGIRGSIHQVGAKVQNAPACNGWLFWCKVVNGQPVPIDQFRQQLRAQMH